MAQLNFYVPDEIEDQVRRAAKRRGLSISSVLYSVRLDSLRRPCS